MTAAIPGLCIVEASLRFALTADPVSTVLLGYSSLEQLEYAAAAAAKGPLPAATVARLPALWSHVATAGLACEFLLVLSSPWA